MLFHSYSLVFGIESGMGSAESWVEGINDLLWSSKVWFSISLYPFTDVEWSVSGILWGKVTSDGVWLITSWVVLMGSNLGWLGSDALGTDWAISWSISSIALWHLAVLTFWTVVSVTEWEVSVLGINSNWYPGGSDELVWGSLDVDVLGEELITGKTSGEELGIGWSAGDTLDTGGLADGGLDETSS
jgi:hypothetical protein